MENGTEEWCLVVVVVVVVLTVMQGLPLGWDCRSRETTFISFAFHILILGMT